MEHTYIIYIYIIYIIFVYIYIFTLIHNNTYWNDDRFGGTTTGESLFLGHGRFHEPLGVASVHPLTGLHCCGRVL